MDKRTLGYYHALLKSSQDIMNQLSAEINMRGTAPSPEEQADFQIAAHIIGMLFDNLVNMGYEIKKGPEEGIYETVINGESFFCHKDAMTVTPVIREEKPAFNFGWGMYGGGQPGQPQQAQTQPNAGMGQPMRQAEPQGMQSQAVNPSLNAGQGMSGNGNGGFNEAARNIEIGNFNGAKGMPDTPAAPYNRQMAMPERRIDEAMPGMGNNGYAEQQVHSASGAFSNIPNETVYDTGRMNPEGQTGQATPFAGGNMANNPADNEEGQPSQSFRNGGYGNAGNAGGLYGGGYGNSTGAAFDGAGGTGQSGVVGGNTNPGGYGETPQKNLYGETGTQEEEVRQPVVMSVGREPDTAQGDKRETFVEERTKSPYDFVFDTMRITITHMNTAGSPEEMHIMIAPLIMTRKPQASVPIVVAFYHKAGYTVKSSYDEAEKGKNLCIIEVGEYSFLCRGAIDGNGNFVSSVVTTGTSAQQGDRLTVVDKKMYGRQSQNPVNGHIKFTHNTVSGPYIIEVFPFDADFNDYIVVARGTEFTDNLCIGNGIKTSSRALVWGGDANFEVLVNKNETVGMIEADIDEQM